MFDSNILHMKEYNNEMKKSLMDKLFFLDKIDFDVIVDFGCADGQLLSFISENFKNISCLGYDISEKELIIAKQNVPSGVFFSDWNELIKYVCKEYPTEKIAIVCNSVIHEVYSYGNKHSVKEFWSRVYNPIFTYTIIRDMCISRNSIIKSDMPKVAYVKSNMNTTRLLNEFEHVWGSIKENKNLIHFLLKYRYEKNWERELHENYIPFTYEEIISTIPEHMNIKYVEHYTLPFIKNQINMDFGLTLDDKTHIKLIVERK